jgi:DNA-binding CsgD family transcriptional regulator/nucleotide-binding universal stress UspA family protein
MNELGPMRVGDALDWLHEQGKRRARTVPEFDLETTLRALRAARDADAYALSPSQALITALEAGSEEPQLTAAELRLLPYLQTHLTAYEIAERLFLSNHTVKTEVKSIYRKLGVSSRAQAVARGRELGLLSQDEPARPADDPRAGEVRGLPGDMARDPGVRRIVVGVDGSAESVAALSWTCREASLRSAEVHAVLALESAVHQVASYAVQPGGSWGAAREVLRQAVSEALGLFPGVRVYTEIAEGLAAPVLLDHAAGADMLVLGRNSRSPDPRAAGPVIRVCLRAARCPVVIISPAAQVAPEEAASAASGTLFDSAEWEARLIPAGHSGY